jgi:hypothetical protein
VASGILLALAAVGLQVKLVSADVNVQLELVEVDELDELDDEGNFGVEIVGVDSVALDAFVAEGVGVGVGVGREVLLLDDEVELLVEVEVKMLWQ